MTEPTLAPFRGTLYAAGAEAVTAPPYDVLDEAEADALRKSDAHNVVHLDLPRPSEAGADPYTASRALLEDWVATGVLAVDSEPSFYVYRQGYRDGAGSPRQTTGVIGALDLDSAGVLPHEETTPKARSDRLALLEATEANLSPIYGLSLAAGVADLLEPEGPPRIAVTDEDGVHHRLWALTAPARTAALAAALASAPVVIADGHHRFEVSRRYHTEHRSTTGAGRTMAFVAPLDPANLVVRPIHRVVESLGVTPGGLRAALDEVADVTEVTGLLPAAVEGRLATFPGVGLVTSQGAYVLRPRPRSADTEVLGRRPGSLRGLDVTWVHDVLLPHLGAAGISFHHSAAHVTGAVADGASAAVLLRAVGIPEIEAVARAGDRMPPKTTFFWPKVRTGMVMRRFADQAGCP